MLEICGEKGTLLHSWWECKLIQLLWRTDNSDLNSFIANSSLSVPYLQFYINFLHFQHDYIPKDYVNFIWVNK